MAKLQHLICLTLWLSSSQLACGQDWASIRGPHFDGSASGEVGHLANGPLDLGVVWKVPVGSGYSGVVKSGDRIVTAMADLEADEEYVVALAAETGETLWKTPTGPVFKGANGSFDGPIATPAVDESRVYHLSPYGELAAYRLEDGRVVWSKNLKDAFSAEPNFYGFGASPILHRGRLIVPVGSPDGAIVAFDPATGEVSWKAGEDRVSFQSPVPIVVDGVPAIAAAGDTKLFAIAADSGKLLWETPHGGASGMPAWSIVPLPLPGDGLFMIDSQNSSTTLDLAADSATPRWTGRDIRNTYCVPVVSGGLLCSYSSRRLTAVDPGTGKRLWRSRQPGNGFLGTIAGRLVVATMEGGLHIGDIDDRGFHQVAASQPFDGSTDSPDGLMWALPSIAGNSIYLRSLGAVARVDVASGESTNEGIVQELDVSERFSRFLEAVRSADNKQTAVSRFLDSHPTPFIDGDHVHFLLRGEYDDVAVGSELFGVRQERRLQRVPGTDLFYYAVRLEEPTRASYVYFADYQPVTDPRNPRRVISSTLTGEMEPTFMGPADPLTFGWFDTGDPDAGLVASPADNPGELAGRLEERTLDSKAMNESIALSIYLPPGYQGETQDAYPVVYVHDGGPALASGNQATIVDDLVQRGVIRPVVAVFIKRRYYVMQGAAGYDKMLADELMPFIEKAFRVSTAREDTASLGGGFGATLGLMGVLPASDRVARIGCHTPFTFEMLQPTIAKLAGSPGARCDVVVEWGAYEYGNPGENWDMAKQSRRIADLLAEGGHNVSAGAVSGGTDWLCWRARSESMWKFLVPRE